MAPINHELELAEAYIRNTGCNIFLTGKAGTGKTTFLRRLRADSSKRLVVTAPTGVAAINAGGVTLHSFFQLPFGPFIPGSETSRSQFRFSREKIDTIKSLDLLVIDEISMVRADLLDGVDNVLRRYRRSDLPFAGVQLLMIGDLFQLPPVVKKGDWQLLHQYYGSPYFFSSKALTDTELVTIELQHIYRQADGRFIKLLNHVRENRLDPSTLAALNQRYIPGFIPGDDDGYITLCTHNSNAETINGARLTALPGKSHRFEADIEGEFPESAYPTAASLELKRGAQVMFIRNDPSSEKSYFNGKIGAITHISRKNIRIQCPGEEEEIEVEPATWENIEYSLNQKTMEIRENKIGAFNQYPLKSAWAITIHKSQGLTFDRAIIDAQAAFAHGQVYVALSRCRTLEGMVLSTPLAPTAVQTDGALQRFSRESRDNRPSLTRLAAATVRYQQQLLLECFDFQQLSALAQRLATLLRRNTGLFHVSGTGDMGTLQQAIEDALCSVGRNFCRQLQGLFRETVLPTDDATVLERLSKAATYFQEHLTTGPGQELAALDLETDNKELGRKANTLLKLLRQEIAVKLAAVRCCEHSFSPSQYFQAISAAAINSGKTKQPGKPPVFSESDIDHPDLFRMLQQWRNHKAEEEGIDRFQVLHQNPLIQIAIHLPDSLAALKRIRGIGKRLTARYGEELVAMVSAYRSTHQIKEVTLPVTAATETAADEPKKKREDTKQRSLELFEQGLNLARIAEQRGLVLSTIEGHMAHWVATGQVAIEALLSPKQRQPVEQALLQMTDTPLGEIKQVLGPEVSYGTIRLVQAHLQQSSPTKEDT